MPSSRTGATAAVASSKGQRSQVVTPITTNRLGTSSPQQRVMLPFRDQENKAGITNRPGSSSSPQQHGNLQFQLDQENESVMREVKEVMLQLIAEEDVEGVKALEQNIDVTLTKEHCLYAAKTGNKEIFLYISQRQSHGSEESTTNHSYFDDGSTCVSIALIEGHFELASGLVKQDHETPELEKLHRADCYCKECQATRQFGEPFESSLQRLNVYKAYCSPVHLCSSVDPLRLTFNLTNDVQKCIDSEIVWRAQYTEIRDGIEKFVCKLMDFCPSADSVPLPGFRVALHHNMKQFISHPVVQSRIQSEYMGNWNDWKTAAPRTNVWRVLQHTLLFPIVSMVCWLSVVASPVKSFEIPFARFLRNATSYFVFVCILTLQAAFLDKPKQRGPPATVWMWFTVAYVLGFSWQLYKTCWRLGFKRFFTCWWNYYDILMLSTFWITFLCWIDTAIDSAYNSNIAVADRMRWDAYDATLIAEGFFAIASILAAFRIFYYVQLFDIMGHIIVILRKSFTHVKTFLVLLLYCGAVFSVAITYAYQGYAGQEHRGDRNWDGTPVQQSSAFESVWQTSKFLYWSLYGYIHPDPNTHIIVGDLSGNPSQPIYNQHRLTQRVGESLLGTYNLIQTVILLNMMVAILSNVATDLRQNANVEWLFVRAQVWAEYFDYDRNLPPPFNLLPSLRSIWLLFSNKCSCADCCKLENLESSQEMESNEECHRRLRVLVGQYIANTYNVLP